MKKLFNFLGSLIATIAVALLVNYWLQSFGNPGYVMIGISHWSLETSLVVFSMSLMMGFFVLYQLFRCLGWLIRLPGHLKSRGKNIRFNRSQEALISGLVDSVEGNWERAENILIKHASHSGAPLIHYLTAARAAQSRGAFDKRDEYLKKATDHAPDSSVLIGLTQAELNLSGNQFEQALETLTRLHSIDPTHANVLKLLHQTYQHVGDWHGIRKLIPSLHSQQVLMEAEVKLLETETYSQLLKQAAATANIEDLKTLWLEIPSFIKTMPSIAAIYFAAMIYVGADNEIEEELIETLSGRWDETLLALFGSLQSNNVAAQLETAEKWSYVHQDNAVLLAVMGKLAIKCEDTFKAESYLAKSIAVEPTVQAYQLLGDLLFAQDDKDAAGRCYKNGLELASSELVSHIDRLPS